MLQFSINPPDRSIEPQLRSKIDNLTKPKGSLGRLEELALQIGLIQQTLTPTLTNPCNILFAADHGVIEEGVSVSPKEVTWQQVEHFTRGGAGINFLCEQHGFRLIVVDAGVDYDFDPSLGVIDMKVRRSTRNFLHEAAMTAEEADLCLARGAAMTDRVATEYGCNVVSFGEMGSGNTSAASMWMHILTGIPLDKCIGAGAGLDSHGVNHKLEVLTCAFKAYKGDGSLWSRLCWFGGLEMMMAVGAMLRAAERGMTILVDGFIMTACMAAAISINPAVGDYAVYGHCGDESGHRLMLDALGARPLLSLSLRLGEGSGAVCAYPILESAVRMINRMDSFKKVSVTKYF
ncbi:MAG: nicotinate-nucleotide--dimethylbenzimidazole phosphoribosyltransferase [Muribaculaceae bacterium]|nr:nicotinate-nucleotide--dimethylbenzimidazole phosphoribosyltransferase [Muribaculaceae bacterium]